MFKFNLKYFVTCLLLFIAEVLIAVYAHDDFIRPYLGDLLVVIWLYTLIKSFIPNNSLLIANGVLVLSFIIEASQYFKLVEILKVQDQLWAQMILGTSFSWLDILSYIIGYGFIILFEFILLNKGSKQQIESTDNLY